MSSDEMNTQIQQYAGAGADAGAQHAAPANPLHMVQDRLQNRWKWVLLLGAILGPCFAVLAFQFAPVKWSAVGVVRVDSKLTALVDATMDTDPIQNFASFVSGQAMLMRSDRVLEAVVQAVRTGKPITGALTLAGRDPQEDIRVASAFRARASDDAEAVAIVRAALTTPVARDSSLIEVRFESSDSGAPAAMVNLVLDAFMLIYGPDAETQHADQQAKIRALASNERLLIERFAEDRVAVLKDAGIFSPNLEIAIDAAQSKIAAIDSRMEAIRSLQKKIDRQYRERRILESTASQPPATTEVAPASTMLEPTNFELEQLDPRLVAIRRSIEETNVKLSLARQKYKPAHPALEKIAIDLATQESLLTAARAGSLQSWREGLGSTQSYGALDREHAELVADRIAVGESIERTNQVAARLDKIDRQIADEQVALSRLAERLRELDREADSIRLGRVRVVEGASRRGAPESDKRVQLAAVGLVGGFILSFGAFFILGSVDPRAFRVSQFRADSKTGRWLGVVPDMTTVVNDAAAKELASNCVHRIRNKIEARRQQGGGYAIMVTSPFQGDGKTTVAVALAWSYAESGHKTVLVDCDFIGRALSHQFKKLHSPGVCEVLRTGVLNDEVVSLGEHLAILPVGADGRFSASNLQIGALRKLMRTLRDRYEIVIVDSGPVTASVEAIPVASSCDGAVLAIRRGRSTTRIPEAVRELTDTGIEYLGLVLNYADADDCRRYGSISKMSAEVAGALGGATSHATPHPLLADLRSSGNPTSRAS